MEQHDRASGQESQQIELWKSGPSIHQFSQVNFAGLYLASAENRLQWDEQPNSKTGSSQRTPFQIKLTLQPRVTRICNQLPEVGPGLIWAGSLPHSNGCTAEVVWGR